MKHSKKIAIGIGLVAMAAGFSLPLRAEDKKPPQTLAQYLEQMQTKLDHTAQRSNKPTAESSSVVGLRGSAQEPASKQLYWKGKQGKEAVSPEEVKAFRSAVDQAHAGKTADAITSLKAFQEKYPEEPAAPGCSRDAGSVERNPEVIHTHSSTPLQLGARITLGIDRLTLGGDGLGRAGNAVVFVPYASPGDTLEVELTEIRKNFARARVIRVIEASPVRTPPPCAYHFTPEKGTGLFCGGCSWQHLNYEFQLDAKRELVQETLERIGGVEGVEAEPTLGMKDPWRYRNKVQQPVGWDGQRLISGFYAPGSHQIMPIEECLVQSELSVKLINRTRALLNEFGLRAYDEDRHTGWIRHLWVRTNSAGQAIIVFVTRTDDFPRQSQVLTALTREFAGLSGIHQNVNPGKTNVILGREWRNCWGEDYLEERLGDLRFRLSPGSFFQVNSLQTEVLYNTVKAYAGKGDTLLDLYGGVGGIALWLASNFRQVIGVDEVKSAISDARRNAGLNGIKNAQFVAGSVDQFISKYRNDFKNELTVVLDPPRAGCDPRVLQALIRLRPSHLIYVSCDPGTLARDLGILAKGGFKSFKIQPVDLFPHTAHVETVVALHKRPN